MKSAGLMSCVIVDDEFPAVKLLADYVQKTSGLELMLKTTSALEALGYINENKVDLVFMDVQMPELSGMELINIIKNTGTKVILTTAYTTYAVEGYEHDIIDYLLKPITLERFLISVSKARTRINSEKALAEPGKTLPAQYIFVKTEYRIQKVSLASIRYIEGLGDYITLHTTSGKILSLERMKNMEEILPSGSFIRIHKSYIINMEQIDFIEKGRIIINKEYLPIGESYKEKVKQQLGLRS
ncbi:LytR/AlgR family response regulator transcription factor [Pedobacter metabolipauper]|uniref:LytTR family two component transcriptional regulator n=1 Tax=Pedobacter metabolipauper TaxID=425513 RepID=A0A4V3D1N8_9SPHI|nr:LytTR family DNA-binding domain-containing protein [Pedobacter metabolipauper]TDQ11843.1 LytTR family two component transcriptional regulator [Pedobacter metabolipauper]